MLQLHHVSTMRDYADAMKNAALPCRIGYALTGWRTVWRNERSFRTQVIGGACAGLALAAAPSPAWVAILILAVGLVLSLECLNAALEYLADTVHPEVAPGIGAAKDAAAGAVLRASLAAVGVAAAFAYSVLS